MYSNSQGVAAVAYFCRVPSAMLLSLVFRRKQGFFDGQGHADSLKAAVVSREYEALVSKQLQEQQRCGTRGTAVTTAVDEIPYTSRPISPALDYTSQRIQNEGPVAFERLWWGQPRRSCVAPLACVYSLRRVRRKKDMPWNESGCLINQTWLSPGVSIEYTW